MFLWNCLASSQVINGVVYDEDTKLPVSNVHVYLDGTSINAVTNHSGVFALNAKSIINTKLVLSHVSYETNIIDRPFNGLSDTLYIKEKIQELYEITVTADRFTRKQKMKVFLEQFLGMSRAGRSCTITNEDDIQLFFNTQTNKLSALSDKPIEVVNDYLGYKISFILEDFWVQYVKESLEDDFLLSSFFSVVSSFSDIAPNNRRIKLRRDDVYEKSTNYFFKHFANNTLEDNKFKLFNKSFPVNPQIFFTTQDTLSLKMINIIPREDINKRGEYNIYMGRTLSGMFSVLFRKNVRSDIYFGTESFIVDRYGNIDQIDKLFFYGQMGNNRAGDMLPIDYDPFVTQ